jgi:large subunit ribosomal protein L25
MKSPSLKVDRRKVLGRKVKTLRREGILPANIYGKKVKTGR